ncbi:serine/threonine protein kinase [Corynebacterium frankenforstense DSM 45800]|uniref:non-specific serine/threonine protein kinase n=1 Tax=Corynebacterium frankenforstense DSM 45800 TaxID=1437875 RepID=A0A1L7CQ69_9CORY|nr:Stk1 family PASTA domain-containing Ser/Thr kinase [Corynebacterium frankenforstense]APT87977.1 serine/threonine protein kinase [Corynebacterium frankenforstense DSM 45800]
MTLIADRYELGDVIGTGGMSEVFAAEDTLLGRGVAVKMLRPEMARDLNFRERFRREAQNSGRLNHPAIVAVYDTGEAEIDGLGVPYIVMERVFGRTLREILHADGPMRPAEAARILEPACRALTASHEAGIVHRDIKPANIMITNTGQVKVMDFGIARALDDSTSAMTQTSAVIGTAQYLSPEQARGKPADGRSDLYALGCVFYELVTGRPPFQGETPFAVAYQHVQEDPVPPSHHIADLTPTEAVNVDSVILTAIAKHPADRYQTADEMASELELLSRGAVTQAARSHVSPAAAGAGYADDDGRDVGNQTATTVMAAGGTHAAERPAPVAEGRPQRHDDRARHRRGASNWPRWIAAVLAVVVLAISGAFAYDFFTNEDDSATSSSAVAVPDVVGWQRTDAEQALEKAGLRVDVNEEPSPDVPRGQVIRTNPGAGSRLQPGTAVVLIVSSGREITDVPDLSGMSLDEARRTLENAGLSLKGQVEEEESDSVPAGQIISQNPAAGSQISKGTEIAVTVSTGKKQVRVPDLKGLSLDEARSTLESMGLRVEPNYVDSREPEDRVLSVDATGSEVDEGSSVTVTVSNGRLIEMPSITRMTRAQAIAALREAGWQGPDSALTTGEPVATGALTDQDKIAVSTPAAGEDLRRDQAVEVRVWDFRPEALLP